jgi:hypothetical protein
VTAPPGSVNVAGFTAIESGATFHTIPATGDLTVPRYYAVSAATAALDWSEPTTVSAVPGSFDSITITSARFKTGDFRIDGTADFDTTTGAPATTITLWLKNNAGALVRVTNGAVPGVPLPAIQVGESPVCSGVSLCCFACACVCLHARAAAVCLQCGTCTRLNCSACTRTLLQLLLLLLLAASLLY